ncbi:hypothetical protein AAG570_000571 [Ranatra chinensis]|uniref:Uncharacterized protein n=1 Tax=Ranatra chinensis TaxID=642074 RepID=A0ABD0YXE8_9HEMI
MNCVGFPQLFTTYFLQRRSGRAEALLYPGVIGGRKPGTRCRRSGGSGRQNVKHDNTNTNKTYLCSLVRQEVDGWLQHAGEVGGSREISLYMKGGGTRGVGRLEDAVGTPAGRLLDCRPAPARAALPPPPSATPRPSTTCATTTRYTLEE